MPKKPNTKVQKEEPLPLDPESLRLEVARKLYRKALSVYESLLLSQDPKIRKEVARDVLEISGAKAPKGSQGYGNVQIALFPPEYVAKVAQGLSKFQRAEIIDVEGHQIENPETQSKEPLPLPQLPGGTGSTSDQPGGPD